MLGIYSRSSSSAVTRWTVASETFFVFPWITFDTVAVLSPSSSARSQIRTRRSSIPLSPSRKILLPHSIPPPPHQVKGYLRNSIENSCRFVCFHLNVFC